MKTKILLLFSLLTTSSVYGGGHLTPSTQCNVITRPGPFVQGNVGMSFLRGKFGRSYGAAAKPSATFGGAIGYSFNESVSADVAVTRRHKFRYDSTPGARQNISSTSVMLTGYYIFPTHTISPYLAAGLGVAFNKAGDVKHTEYPLLSINGKRSKSFSWQLGTGIKLKVSENVMLDLGYKFVNSGSFRTMTNGTDSNGEPHAVADGKNLVGKLKAHEITLGVIYKF